MTQQTLEEKKKKLSLTSVSASEVVIGDVADKFKSPCQRVHAVTVTVCRRPYSNRRWLTPALKATDLDHSATTLCLTFLAEEFSNFGRKNIHTSTRPCWRGRDYAQYMWDWHPTQVVHLSQHKSPQVTPSHRSSICCLLQRWRQHCSTHQHLYHQWLHAAQLDHCLWIYVGHDQVHQN